MLHLRNISRSFGNAPVLRGVNLDIDGGTLVGLIGPSGGGKSVLLKIIGGIDPQYTGSLTFDTAAPTISLMFQEGALFDSMSVFDNVAFPLVQGRVPLQSLAKEEREAAHDKVSTILARVGLSRAYAKMPGQLSGGMRRRASLARALVSRPELVLLDDPTCGLDPISSGVIMDLIVEMQSDYKPTMVVISHDLRRLLPVVDSMAALFNGVIGFDGTLSELVSTGTQEIKHFVSCRYELNSIDAEGEIRK